MCANDNQLARATCRVKAELRPVGDIDPFPSPGGEPLSINAPMDRSAAHEEDLLGLAEPVRLRAAIWIKVCRVDVEKLGADGLAR